MIVLRMDIGFLVPDLPLAPVPLTSPLCGKRALRFQMRRSLDLADRRSGGRDARLGIRMCVASGFRFLDRHEPTLNAFARSRRLSGASERHSAFDLTQSLHLISVRSGWAGVSLNLA
jgi:hypothetical protein